MKVDIAPSWEMQNVVRTRGGLRTRPAFASLRNSTAGTVYLAAFSVESPSTTEPWHYLIEQTLATLACTLRVFTEEFVEIFSYDLGVLPEDAVVTKAEVNNQLLVSSPAFSQTLFGQPGGGLITAQKTLSEDPTIVTLDVPVGHITAFGSAVGVAVGNNVFFNQSRRDLDPRTFVAEGIQNFPGAIYDLFQGVDGRLYAFTSAGVFTVPADALGAGQTLSAFISRVPGVDVRRPRNAAPTDSGVVVLQADSVLVLGSSARKIDIPRFEGQRAFARVVDVDDMRIFGQVHPLPGGFAIGFRDTRPFFIVVDLTNDSVSYWYDGADDAGASTKLVGTLTTRDGEPLFVCQSKILAPWITGARDHDSERMRGVVAGMLELPTNEMPVVRRVTVGADNVGSIVGAAVGNNTDTGTTTTHTGDVVIGTSLWSASGATPARALRTNRVTVNKRMSEPQIEAVVDGGDRRIAGSVDIDVGGVINTRRDKRT